MAYSRARRRTKALHGMFTTIRPTSPDPSTYAGFPEDMDDWECGTLEQYYWNLVDAFGKEQARLIWNADTDRIGFWGEAQSCRYNCEWNNRMRAEGLSTGSNIISNAYCTTSNVVEGIGLFTNPKTVKMILTIGGIALAVYGADKIGLLKRFK